MAVEVKYFCDDCQREIDCKCVARFRVEMTEGDFSTKVLSIDWCEPCWKKRQGIFLKAALPMGAVVANSAETPSGGKPDDLRAANR